MDKARAVGTAQVAGGTLLAYEGVKHGLPRALGIRIENHTTSKKNAYLIKKGGGFLDPAFGGKHGWSEKINCSEYIENSKGYVHITGTHPDGFAEKLLSKKKLPEFLKKAYPTISRKANSLMYRTVGNLNAEDFKAIVSGATKLKDKQETIKWLGQQIRKGIFANKTKKLYIPGIDSYFTKEFIPDPDSAMALKSTKPVKAYTSRFEAMLAGLKNFGLKGIKENKGRVAFGVGLVATGVYFGAKLIKKGIDNLSRVKE